MIRQSKEVKRWFQFWPVFRFRFDCDNCAFKGMSDGKKLTDMVQIFEAHCEFHHHRYQITVETAWIGI